MKPTLLMASQLPQGLVDQLEAHYRVLGPFPSADPAALPVGAEEAVALLTIGGLPTRAALLDALPALRLVACYGTGYEGVELAACRERGIAVTTAGDANATAVAEFTFGLILASARRLLQGDAFVRSGRWQGNAVERMPQVPGLAGRRLGIYGLGEIGRRIARRGEAFDMEIGYFNRSPREGLDYAYHGSLLELARWSDVLVVAVRASAETVGAVDAGVLAALGAEGHLVNISRGSVVDEEALAEALEQGVIAGAALDVFAREPDVPERLRQQPNLVLSPHVAANAASAQQAQQQVMLANLEAMLEGGELRNRIA
ncbi:NAD(P)-dependent oxidoreductase [Pseudomonas sp. LA5]|uniref:NAD(P)-dependent oxidoreductase n=1 Tax=Pseudomonas sp. LA5 TaxID=3027850 RepID=UPI00235E3BDA|nr:NAD(P)-dependent oxidoreductase [Pseudomonas sp. LA5]